MIEAAFIAILEGDESVCGIVSNRINIIKRPQFDNEDATTFHPAITIRRSGTEFEEVVCETQEPQVELTLECYAARFATLASLVSAIFSLIRTTYSDNSEPVEVTAGDVVYAIDDITLIDYSNDHLLLFEGDSKGIYTANIEVRVTYET